MLRKSLWVCVAMLGGMLGGAVAARGAQLVAGAVPSEARWVMHLNVEAVRGTALWDLVWAKFGEPRKEAMEATTARIEAITGARLPRDLRGVTLYGTGFDEMSVGLLIYAPLDEARVMGVLRGDPEFRTSEHHGHTILTWRDKERDRLMYGSFVRGMPVGKEVVILAPSARMVALGLDTMDKRSPATANVRLLPGAGPGGGRGGSPGTGAGAGGGWGGDAAGGAGCGGGGRADFVDGGDAGGGVGAAGAGGVAVCGAGGDGIAGGGDDGGPVVGASGCGGGVGAGGAAPGDGGGWDEVDGGAGGER